MPEIKNSLRVLLLLLGLALLFLTGRAYRLIYPSAEDREAVIRALQRDAEELNATLPEMVSDSVRLEATRSGPGNAFQYQLTITDDAVALSIAADPKRMRDLEAQLHARVCARMPLYRERGTIVSYLLKDNAGAPIAEISVNPEDCSYADIHKAL
ncbi:MAG TPA: hypothetical protein VK446_00070 [Methylocystis sp.]|nr:hypothetical protein [Methylocystis sp.]